MKHDEFLQVLRSPFHFATCDAVLRGCKIVDISKPLQWRRLSKRCVHPLAPSARGLRPQAVGERTVRLSEIFRAMARFSPSAPSGHLPRRGRFFDTLRGRESVLFFASLRLPPSGKAAARRRLMRAESAIASR